MSHIHTAIPILRSFDAAIMRAFYGDYLGFDETFAHRFAPDMPLYVEMKRGDCRLHLSEHHGDASPGGAVRMPMDDVRGYCAALQAKKPGNVRPCVDAQPFGWDDMTIVDPFGNTLIFCTEQTG